jgi:hypothetical protein
VMAAIGCSCSGGFGWCLAKKAPNGNTGRAEMRLSAGSERGLFGCHGEGTNKGDGSGVINAKRRSLSRPHASHAMHKIRRDGIDRDA